MKYRFLILLWLVPVIVYGQDSPEPVSVAETVFDNVIENEQEDIEDDTFLQQLEAYRRRPLNLNIATEEEIAALKMLHELQLKNFMRYRMLMGNLISIYELQAIPGWDINVIRQLLPYITVSKQSSLAESLSERRKGGTNSILLRYATILEKPAGYNKPVIPGSQYYYGSCVQLMMRYKYNYKNLLQLSLVGEKDAGEEFFRGSQKQGFGFYSGHLLLRNIGIVRCFVLGDFTINMGQGLMQWQSFAFGKGSSVLSVKKQSPTVVPYNSTGELNFQRGVGITIGKKKWESVFFMSHRNLSGNITADAAGNEQVTSFNSSGYYRTSSELADRGNTGQISFGTTLKYKSLGWHIALNAVHYSFTKVLQKRDELYNLYSVNGNKWWNAGIDYSYTYRNIHFFGETATDKKANLASLNGLLISLDSKVEISLVYRNISRKYQSMYAGAFTENTLPSNEKGIYIGISLRPATSVKLEAYADIYRFPWLKYRVNANSWGSDYLLQMNYTPNKSITVYTRLHYKTRQQNETNTVAHLQPVISFPQLNWRWEANFGLDNISSISNRFEIAWIKPGGSNKEEGFLSFVEYFRKILNKRINASFRIQYFESSGYNTRIYALERDLLYAVSIPSFFDKGLRYYINSRFDLNQFVRLIVPSAGVKIEGCLKWCQSIFPGKLTIGEGLDQVEGNAKSNLKLQFLIFF